MGDVGNHSGGYSFPPPEIPLISFLLSLQDLSPRRLHWAKIMPSMLLAWVQALILPLARHDSGKVTVLKWEGMTVADGDEDDIR